MTLFDRISDFVKSGPRRLEDALELMEVPTALGQRSDGETRHLRGAMYLAGYGVECMLKAYLIDQELCQSLRKAQDKINRRRASQNKAPIKNIATSKDGHSIEYIIGLTDLSTRDDFDAKMWSRLAKWDTSWRYNPHAASREEAERFVNDVRRALNWLRPKMVTR